ncbi:MAG TPA: phage/plasmid replication protein [Promineifilum sp.]|nr:phage/plasmid replication protein [Promineifilum sp.]
MSSVFIDWISAAQRHSDPVPVVSDGVRVRGKAFEVLETADGAKWCVVTPNDEGVTYQVPRLLKRGSHDTALQVRSDGHLVELSGNVGRWERPDNVWNYDFDDTISKAGEFLESLGLPAFSAGECRAKASLSKHDYDLGLWNEWTGAYLRELHVTRNYYAGNEKLAGECIRYFGGLRAARIAKGVFGDETVQFGKRGGKLHKRLIVYRKAAEMLAHAKGDEAKKRVRESQEYQFARDMGLIRVECKWGKDFLRDHALRFVGDVSMGKIVSLFEKETGFLHDVTPDRAARIVSDMPTKIRSSALHWIRGDDLRDLLPRATYFRHVKALRDYGIDASEPRGIRDDGSVDQLQRLLDGLPQFELRELAAPSWYGLPEIERRAA